MVTIEIESEDLQKMKEHIQVSVDYLKKAPLNAKHIFAQDIVDGENLIKGIEEYQKEEQNGVK